MKKNIKDIKKKGPKTGSIDLQESPKIETKLVLSSNWKVQLTYDDGKFIINWSASNIGAQDFVALYPSINSPDDAYISGTWALASSGTSFKTSQAVHSGIQARYLIYDTNTSQYVSQVRTDPFPRVRKCSAPIQGRQICLSPTDGRFRITWKASGYQTTDFVALYPNATAPIDQYIGGTKMQAQTPPWSEDTAVPLQPEYEARFIVRDSNNQNVIAARTGGYDSLTVYSKSIEYPRKPTSTEWTTLLGFFPQLNQSNVWVTGPETPLGNVPYYNCIAWSLSLDDRWINPDPSLADFNTQYEQWGKKPESAGFPSALIDGWGTRPSGVVEMQHGSKKYSGVSVGVSDLWESKLGPYIRITHSRRGLNSTIYGTILTSFVTGFALFAEGIETITHKETYDSVDMSILEEHLDKIPKDLKEKFELAFSDWKNTWFTGAYLFSSDTKDMAKSKEFAILEDMGEEIIPLVLAKLQEEENFVALVLYDKLQTEESLVIRYKRGDPYRTEGEQARAKRSIEKWILSIQNRK